MLAALFPLGFLESNSPGVQSLYFNLTFVLSTDYLFLAISECYQVLELILVLLITERDVFANPDRSKLGRSSLASWDNLEWLPLRAAPVAVTWHAGHRCNSLEDLFSFRRAIPAGVTLLSTSSRPPPHFSTTLMYIYIYFFHNNLQEFLLVQPPPCPCTTGYCQTPSVWTRYLCFHFVYGEPTAVSRDGALPTGSAIPRVASCSLQLKPA